MSNFSLQPFPDDLRLPAIEIDGKIDRDGGRLSIEYQLIGNLTAVEIPALAATPTRKFHLWEATCFEFFLGIPEDRSYWEFNLSPAGDWNIFHLDDYRQGLRDELAFTSLPFTVEQKANSLLLALEFDLSKIIPVDRSIDISITTVMKSIEGEISYWALTHCGSEADFHRRDSFVIKIG
jgi:hypothetical protein